VQSAAAHSGELAPYVLLYFSLHVLLQYVVPLLRPDAYDVLAGPAGSPSPSPAARRKLAAEARTKIIATLMALEVSILGLYGLCTAEGASLFHDLYSSSYLTDHIVRVAVGYFAWDVVACVLDGEALAYHLHGWACLAVFVAALHPFLHYMSMVALSFEASTPFLHARALMITRGNTKGAAFKAMELLFVGSFFATRIGNGYYQFYRWWGSVEALLASGGAHNPAIVRMYQGLCMFLAVLNGYWFAIMVYKGCGFGRKRKGAAADKKVA
jgi:hypothetical protein